MSEQALPSMSHVAYTLVLQGNPALAGEFLDSVMSWHMADRMKCEALRLALRSVPPDLDSLQLPFATVNLALVKSLLAHGRCREAEIVLRVFPSLPEVSAAERTEAGRMLALLQTVFAPLYADASEDETAFVQLVGTGQVRLALQAFSKSTGGTPAPLSVSLAGRVSAIKTLLLEHEIDQLSASERLHHLLRSLHWPQAIGIARELGDTALADALGRLEQARSRTMDAATADEESTLHTDRNERILLFVQMARWSDAERICRKMWKGKYADDTRVWQRLTDLVLILQRLGEPVDSVPLQAAKIAWLQKNTDAIENSQIWRTASPGSRPGEVDEVTDVARVDDQAEQLLKVGDMASALALYQVLAVRYPERAVYRERITEIEALIAHRTSSESVASDD